MSDAKTPDRERIVLLSLCAIALLGCLLGLLHPPHDGSPRERLTHQGLDLVRLAASVVLVFVLLLGPGIVWRASGARRRLDLGFLPLPGLGLLAATGTIAWGLSNVVAPRTLCVVTMLPVLGAIAVGVVGADPGRQLVSRSERRALFVIGCVFAVAIGRSLWSVGPFSETYAHTISRTLEAGDRPDSRISFHIVQLIANTLGPFSGASKNYFAPYDFSSRGPLAGLASTPIVLLAGAHPPLAKPEQPWAPFDAEGFMAYRVAMIAFACSGLLSVWSLARRLAGTRAAHFALLLAATTPFLVHDVWFTWPKILAASFVLLAATALLTRRPVVAGLLAGAGYLVHPLALLWVPALGLIALWPIARPQLRRPRWRTTALFAAAIAGPLVAWRLALGSHYSQSSFITQIGQAGLRPGPFDLSAWLSERLVSLYNTLIPFHMLVAAGGDDPAVNTFAPTCAPHCISPFPVQHFFFQYWNTLPFGIGITFFVLLVLGLLRAGRRWPWPVIASVVVPFVGFWLYWGGASTGLLREGLHPWVLTLLVVVAVEQHSRRFPWLRSRGIRLLLALRAVEVLLVAMLPTLKSAPYQLYDSRYALTDAVAIAGMVGGCACLATLIWRQSQA
jgi:hypothetical protein